jgi:hypothetical protein
LHAHQHRRCDAHLPAGLIRLGAGGNVKEENQMKQYLLSIYQPDGPPPPPSVALERVMQDVDTLIEEAKAGGVWVFSGGLHSPGTTTVVRLREGQVLTTDGLYVEGKEHIGGFLIVKGPDLDAALEWGRKLAQATARRRGPASGSRRSAAAVGISAAARASCRAAAAAPAPPIAHQSGQHGRSRVR